MANKQKVSVSIDPDLLTFIDTHTINRSEAINEALTQWRQEKIQAEIDNAYAQAAAKEIDSNLGEENWLLNDQALQADID